jgi:hypothetical protein
MKDILELLRMDEHYGSCEVIEIAKGKYERPTTFKKLYKQIKRLWKAKRN